MRFDHWVRAEDKRQMAYLLYLQAFSCGEGGIGHALAAEFKSKGM